MEEEVAVGAVVVAVGGLEASEATSFTGRFLVEPVAVGVELVFDEIFVIYNIVFFNPFGMLI